jgi:pSer/pThr/pTyr-binding forkhead associated (FHA) protein/ribosomal protein L40E
METDVGFVCGRCDAYAPLEAASCPSCGAELGFPHRGAAATASPAAIAPLPTSVEPAVVEAAPVVTPVPEPAVVGPLVLPAGFVLTEALMDQARSYVCKKCYTPVPPGHKFCGRCGESVPREILGAQTMLLSKMLEPGKAKLVVIKGEGFSSDQGDETVFLLGGRQHPAGRTLGQILFDRDPWVSPKHANFYYRDDGKLVVKDDGSLNGVFTRVRQPMEMNVNDVLLAGEQVFRLEATPRAGDQPDPDGTYFYSSPKRPSPFRLTQMLRGGATGMLIVARETSVTVGRDACDMNFPNDPYMSGRHCKVEMGGNGKYTLTDMGSKNGTYLRISGERELGHGDYIFIGRELLRVDISA